MTGRTHYVSLCECRWEGEKVRGGKQEGVGEKRKRQGHDGEMVMEWGVYALSERRLVHVGES